MTTCTRTHIYEKTWFPRELREGPAQRDPSSSEITDTAGSLYEYTSPTTETSAGPRALVPDPQPQAQGRSARTMT